MRRYSDYTVKIPFIKIQLILPRRRLDKIFNSNSEFYERYRSLPSSRIQSSSIIHRKTVRNYTRNDIYIIAIERIFACDLRRLPYYRNSQLFKFPACMENFIIKCDTLLVMKYIEILYTRVQKQHYCFLCSLFFDAHIGNMQ